MPSRLSTAQSAYLRSAEHQPVQWYPWGAEPFERARQENKPVLLDIGAVWCHWCHVMDGESYENPLIAEILNRDWICIKVDRDERPDVDARYQRAVQALTQQGGWPLTAFLTADGEVFYGGTYFPPDERYGRPGFATVLTELARLYHEQRDRISAQATEIRNHVSTMLSESRAGAISPDMLDQASDAMARLFDFRNGGFGNAPKFPAPGACDFLLARWYDTGEKWAREIVERTLTAMARGGVYDQVAGGFHRYSVDARWTVPHFEKMLYDNSELLRVYAHALAAATDAAAVEEYRRIVGGIADWTRSVMADPAGGYFASQDADVGLHDDGDYFTWTVEEAKAATSEAEFRALARHYDIEATGEMHHNPAKNVLWIRELPQQVAVAVGTTREEAERLISAGREKLLAARRTRPTPFVDQTIYTGWNAMMASAVLEAMTDDAYALRVLERLFREAAPGEGVSGVRHAIGSDVSGILEDQVHLANASIDAYEATGEPRWLTRAANLANHAWAEYADTDGGLFDTPKTQGGEGFLKQRLKPVQDAPTPSPNGVAGIVAARLAEHTGQPEWRDRLEKLLRSVAGGLVQLSIHGATLLRAADWYLNPAAHIVVVGEARDPQVAEMIRAARATYRPRKVITRLQPGATRPALPHTLRAMINSESPRGYVCAGPQCGPPARNAEQLVETLTTLGRA